MINIGNKILLKLRNAFILLMLLSCSSAVKDTFNSVELISSKGEKIYVNSLNWGVTDDNQITAISGNKEKVKDRADTLYVTKGLEPFIYNFKTDTLKLFFNKEINYKCNEIFRTISVSYIVLGTKEYNDIRQKAYKNELYRTVPMREIVSYPSDMPKAPSK